MNRSLARAPLSLAVLLSLVLASCQSLPERQAPGDRYVALYVERGSMSIQSATLDASAYLESTLTPEPLHLKSGWNFVKVPASDAPVRLVAVSIAEPSQLDTPARRGYLGYEIAPPREGTIVLVAKKLRYFMRVAGNTGHVVFETSDLDDTEVSRVLQAWNDEQKGDRPARWDEFIVARPETKLF